jgi:hypothetical protein
MSQAVIPQELRSSDEALVISLEWLRLAVAGEIPGREREWAEAVADAVAGVETALRLHKAAARAPDGLLAEVDETRPTLARKAAELRSDHDAWLGRVLCLRAEAARVAQAFQPAVVSPPTRPARGVADFGAIRNQARQVLAGLEENREEEMKLVLESVNTDIGVGD